MRKKLLTASCHPGSARPIIPVIKAFEIEDKYDVVNLCQGPAVDVFKKGGLEFKTLEDYGIKGVSLEGLKKVLDIEKPDGLLVGTSGQEKDTPEVIEQKVVLAGIMGGVRAIGVLDAWCNYLERVSDIYTGETFKYMPYKMAIMDKAALREMLDLGFREEDLVVTGNPCFEDHGKRAERFTYEQQQAMRRHFGFENTSVVGVWLGTVLDWMKPNVGFWETDNMDVLVNAFKQMPNEDVGMVIRSHLRTTENEIDLIREVVEKSGDKRLVISNEGDYVDVILASDVALTTYSTGGMEALYLGKPCVSIQPGLTGQDYFFASREGIVPFSHTPEGCEGLVQAVMTNRDYRREIVEKAASFRPEGKATPKIKKLVEEVLEI